MRSDKIIRIGIAILLLLHGCGIDNRKNTAAAEGRNTGEGNGTEPPLVIQGYTLPPEPDETLNNSILLGIDSNHNGVRDDVERWIYITYNTHIPCTKEIVTETLPDGRIIEGVVKEECEDEAVPYHQIVREIAMQGARAAQIIIQEPEKAKETTHLMDAAQACNTYFMNRAKTYNDPILIDHVILINKGFNNIQFNTVERSRAYAQYNFTLSGGVYRMPTDEQMRGLCDFDVDALLAK